MGASRQGQKGGLFKVITPSTTFGFGTKVVLSSYNQCRDCDKGRVGGIGHLVRLTLHSTLGPWRIEYGLLQWQRSRSDATFVSFPKGGLNDLLVVGIPFEGDIFQQASRILVTGLQGRGSTHQKDTPTCTTGLVGVLANILVG